MPSPVLNYVTSIIVSLFLIAGVAYLALVAIYLIVPSLRDTPISKGILANATSTLGLPFAALGSFVLVVALPLTTGEKLNFNGLSIHIEGPSSQLLYWVVIYLSITASIRLLLPKGR